MNLPATHVNGHVVLEGVCVILISEYTLLQCIQKHTDLYSLSTVYILFSQEYTIGIAA